MNDKKKDLNPVPAIKPAQDEVASYRSTNRSDAPKQSNFNGMLVFSLVLMAIMMGVGGYTLFEVQQRLDQSNKILEEANKNVRDLESRLEATGTDVSKTIQVIQSKQETNFSEIDKLWKIAYRQNRPKLQELEKKVGTISAGNLKLTTQTKNLSTDVNKVTSELNRFTKSISDMRQNLLKDNQKVNTQVTLVRGQVQDQADLVEGNRRSISALDNKVKNVEESIDVFDRYRQQVNQRLLDLQNQIQTEPEPTQPPTN